MLTSFFLIVSAVAVVLLASVSAFAPNQPAHSQRSTELAISRSEFLSFTAAATLMGVVTTTPVQAKEIPAGIKGTKEDPSYQACVSKCIY